MARALPIRRGRRWVPPAPGMMPSEDSVWPILERPSSTMTRKSQHSVSSLPPPSAWPLMAAITGFGHRSMAMKWWFIRRMNSAIWSVASGASRSMPIIEVRSAPTLKYFSYSDASTTTRTDGSLPSSSNAAASACIRSSAIALLPLRCMTTRATAPSRLTSTSSPIAGLGREQRDAARDLDHRARDVAGLLGAQERDRAGDVLGLAEALENGPRLEALVHRVVGGGSLARLGLDDARRDRVGRDVVPAALKRGRPGQADQAGLGRRVARLAETAKGAGDRGHEDQPAPLVLDHVRPYLFRAVEGAGEVDLHIAVPQLVGLVGDLGRVVDQDVDLAELVLDLLEDLFDLVAVGDVHLDGEGLASHLPDLLGGCVGVNPALRHRDLGQHAALRLGRLLQVGVVLDEDVRDDDVGAHARERQRVLAAEAARRTGDDRDLACQVKHSSASQFDGRALAGDGARDDKPLDLRRALPDLVDLGVPKPLLDWVLLDVPVAAENLDGVGRDLHRHVGGEALGHRTLRALERVAQGGHPAGAPDEQACGVDLHRHVGELEAHSLVLRKGLAELLAVLGVLEGELVGRARDAERAGGYARPRRLQRGQRAERSRAGVVGVRLAAEAVVERNVAVLEDHLRGMAGADAELLLLAAHPQSRRVLLDQERGDPRRAFRRVGVGVDDVVVGDAAVGAELLGAV